MIRVQVKRTSRKQRPEPLAPLNTPAPADTSDTDDLLARIDAALEA